MKSGIPFIDRTGADVEVAERGFVRARMPFEPNINHVGIMYAGALFTLAEYPAGLMCGATFDTERFFPIVKDVHIRFRRPASTDVTVEMRLAVEEIARIETEAAEQGKADFAIESELVDAGGVVVAVAEALYQLRSVSAPIG